MCPLRRLHLPSDLPDFASNDYLGLSRSPLFLSKTYAETERLQRIGSTGSRLLTGNSPYAMELEERIAQFHRFEAALLFGSGYMANLGLLSALEGPFYYDTHIHPSIRDGIKLSMGAAYPLRHNDLNHLMWRLQRQPGTVIVESIYSTDGSKAPLAEITNLVQQYRSRLIVDEAHAIGVYGEEGRGFATNAVFAKVITFSKALGCYGGAVLCSAALKQRLLNTARSCIYSTALPYPSLAALSITYDFFPKMDQERNYLYTHTLGETHLYAIPYQNLAPPFALAHLRPPTVAKEVWRIALHSYNTSEEVKRLKTWIQSL